MPPQTAQDADALVARLHLLASLTFLTAGAAQLAWRGGGHAAWLPAVAPVAMGGFVLLIMGTSRLLMRGMAGRPLVGAAWLAALPAGSVALGALAAWAALEGVAAAEPWALLWTAGLASHALLVGLTVSRPRADGVRRPPRPPGAIPRRALEAASLAYAVAAALAWPLALQGRLPLASAVHLLLPGFVVLTILATGAHVLPRFTGVAFPRPLLAIVAATAPAGPALLAWAMRAREALPLAAAVEATALSAFALAVLWMLARSPRPRVTFAAYAGAALSVAGGVALGVLFALDPAWQRLVPMHAMLNVLGFVGLVVVGASLDVYAPALGRGARGFRAQARVVSALALGGVGLAGLGYLAGAPDATRAGLGAVALGLGVHAAGAAALAWRTTRPRDLPLMIVGRAPDV